jgi:hypothetical protein
MSRAVSRAMAQDHPIGDPVGGAAYGERNDPISAIVAISSMAGTYAAAGTFAAMTVMQGITFVGAALSLVGNVTGNATLSKIGMIAGLAGGIGQFADYAMGTQMGGTLGQLGNKMGLNNIPGLSNVSMGTDALAMSQDQLKSNIGAYGGVTPKGFVEGVSSSGTSVPYTAGYNPNSAGALANPAGSSVSAAAAPAAAAPAAPVIESVTPPVFDTLKDAGKGVLAFTKANPEAASIIAKSVGGLADWMSGKTDAEIAAMKAQVGYADARAMQIQQEIEREKTRRINVNKGYAAVDTGLNVNTNALMQSPSIAAPTVALPGQGLINTARIG